MSTETQGSPTLSDWMLAVGVVIMSLVTALTAIVLFGMALDAYGAARVAAAAFVIGAALACAGYWLDRLKTQDKEA